MTRMTVGLYLGRAEASLRKAQGLSKHLKTKENITKLRRAIIQASPIHKEKGKWKPGE